MKKMFFIAAICLTAASSCCKNICNNRSGYDVTLESLLDEMTCRDAITRYPSIEYKQAQVSSYDRRTVAPDQPGWWANNDGGGYERLDTVAGRYEKVMCDLKGAGAVTRIWMTTKEKYGTIRIYLDGSRKPQIVIPAYDMKRFPIYVPEALSLKHTHYDYAMGGVGGNTFFLPIPFAESCKITFEEPDITVFIPRYYHIGYRMYPEGTKVRTFSLAEAKRLSSKIQAVSDALLAPYGEEEFADASERVSGTVANSGAVTLTLPEGTKAVSGLEIKVSGFTPDTYADAMRSLRFEARFDGVKTASAPLSDFCGAGMGAPKVDGWWLSADGAGSVICRLPMPYRQNGSISVVNTNRQALTIEIVARAVEYEWDARSLYFHTTWRSEEGIPVSPDYDSPDNLDWNFVTLNGRGKYVGDLLSLDNHAIDWYGEGDEKIFVDGEAFPSHMGTGTEDYYNCSWAPVYPFLTPYGGAPRVDDQSSHGINAFLRMRILDDIPFAESLRFDIEMLSWHPGTVDYYTTAYWYGDLDASSNATE